VRVQARVSRSVAASYVSVPRGFTTKNSVPRSKEGCETLFKFYDISEAGSASIIRCKRIKDRIQLDPSVRASLDQCYSTSGTRTHRATRDKSWGYVNITGLSTFLSFN
jgi:hypothetical protein